MGILRLLICPQCRREFASDNKKAVCCSTKCAKRYCNAKRRGAYEKGSRTGDTFRYAGYKRGLM